MTNKRKRTIDEVESEEGADQPDSSQNEESHRMVSARLNFSKYLNAFARREYIASLWMILMVESLRAKACK